MKRHFIFQAKIEDIDSKMSRGKRMQEAGDKGPEEDREGQGAAGRGFVPGGPG